jgi:hypothetical protein
MPYNQGSNLEAGFELLFSNFEQFEEKFYETLYQKMFWRDAIPGGSIETNINPGASTASYGVSDWRGIGGFIADYGGDAPTVFFSRDKVSVPMAYAGVKGVYSREDMRSFNFAYGGSLDTELANIMRNASERHMEGVLMYGQAELNFDGYIDLPGVDVANVPDGASTDPEWSTKTADEILLDMNEIIESIWIDSNQIHLPDTLELPPTQYALINRLRIADAVDNSVLKYFQENNLYYARTGQKLNIIPNPHLAGAGVAGVDRMLAKVNDVEIFKMPFPIPHNLLPPQLEDFSAKILAEYKFGPIHIRYPGAMAYRDSI